MHSMSFILNAQLLLTNTRIKTPSLHGSSADSIDSHSSSSSRESNLIARAKSFSFLNYRKKTKRGSTGRKPLETAVIVSSPVREPPAYSRNSRHCSSSIIDISVEALSLPQFSPLERSMLHLSSSSSVDELSVSLSSSSDSFSYNSSPIQPCSVPLPPTPPITCSIRDTPFRSRSRSRAASRRRLFTPAIVTVTGEDEIGSRPMSPMSAVTWVHDHLEDLDLSAFDLGEGFQINHPRDNMKRDSSILPTSNLDELRVLFHSSALHVPSSRKPRPLPIPVPPNSPAPSEMSFRRPLRPLPSPPVMK